MHDLILNPSIDVDRNTKRQEQEAREQGQVYQQNVLTVRDAI